MRCACSAGDARRSRRHRDLRGGELLEENLAGFGAHLLDQARATSPPPFSHLPEVILR